MKTEFEFAIPRHDEDRACLVQASVAPDQDGNPVWENNVIGRHGEEVETRPDEDSEIIDKAIELLGEEYAHNFGDRGSDATIRARVDWVLTQRGDHPRAAGLSRVRFAFAQQLENWRAEDIVADFLKRQR